MGKLKGHHFLIFKFLVGNLDKNRFDIEDQTHLDFLLRLLGLLISLSTGLLQFDLGLLELDMFPPGNFFHKKVDDPLEKFSLEVDQSSTKENLAGNVNLIRVV